MDNKHNVVYEKAMWGFAILVILNAICISGLILNRIHFLHLHFHLFTSLVWIGVINFYGVMLLSNYLSGSNPINTWEFRQALTASFVITYITAIVLSILPDSHIKLDGNKCFDSFSQLTLLIVTYYFGSRIIQDFVKPGSKDDD